MTLDFLVFIPLIFVLFFFIILRNFSNKSLKYINKEAAEKAFRKLEGLRKDYKIPDRLFHEITEKFIADIGIEDPDLAEAIAIEWDSQRTLEWFKNSKEIDR